MPLVNLGNYSLAPAAGSATTTQNLDLIDLSRLKWIRLELEFTGVGTADAGDTLDVSLQEASDDTTPTWDTRAAFPQLTGAMTVSAAAPEKRVIQWWCMGGPITATDASYEPSGSAGAAALAAGAFIPGPLKGKRYASGGQVARHRIAMTVSDADADAQFTATLRVYGESWS